jgi:putative endonuclease
LKKYFVYIICNQQKNVLYVGITNNWQKRIAEHIADAENLKHSFAGKYNCRYLLHLEEFMFVYDAIAREKEIKGWSRMKKEKLITKHNPDWIFLNEHV